MTIIIETPAPPTRERLVLVPEGVPPRDGRPAYRDATPADLERAGWVPLAAFVGPLDLLSPPTLAGALEAIAHLRADRAIARAAQAERERDEALLRAHTGVVHYEILRQSGEEAARQRDEARAEVARLTAPGEGSEGEPTDRELASLGPGIPRIDIWRAGERAGVAHERARQQPEKDRALALAARVRQERCLVAEAVGMGTGVTISRTSERVPSTTGMWDVYVTRRPDVPGEHYAYGVPTADVPATLARLLGEVSRG